jgi:hypothetical protein
MAYYRIDSFYREGNRLEALPQKRMRIVASDDSDAIRVANATIIRPEPAYFEVRALTRNERLIYTSPVKGGDNA